MEVTVPNHLASAGCVRTGVHARGRALRIIGMVFALAGTGFIASALTTHADDQPYPERVRGFFCNAKQDSLDFLRAQAEGENEEIAANTVNKSIGKFSCAYYLPADAIYTGEHTVIQDGIVYKLHSFMFLPEKVERWSGTAFGSLQQPTNAKHDV